MDWYRKSPLPFVIRGRWDVCEVTEKRELTEAELEQRRNAAQKHGVRAYEDAGRLPANVDPEYDRKLAMEILDATGDPESVGFRLLAQSAARRATLIHLAYSYLSREDIDVFWVEIKNGRNIVRHQPILDRLGTYHEGLRRDLQELGMTPAARVRLDLGMRQLTLDDLLDQPVGGDDGSDGA